MPDEHNRHATRWPLFASELIGTAMLVFGGLSFVILDFGTGSPVARLVPSDAVRRLITGFLFGATGASIAVSPVGKVSGAHLNPVVTLAFWLWRKLDGRTALTYVAGQLVGGIAGCWPLLGWGAMGRSVDFGATVPGTGWSTAAALFGEIITTFTMVLLLSVFLGFRGLRRFTPLLFPFLYAVMVCLEAPISGTSTNPARTLGPAVVSGAWQGWWIYFVGPGLGAVGATLATSALARRIEVAKLYYFDADPSAVLHRAARSRLSAG